MPAPDEDLERRPVFLVTQSTAALVRQDVERYEPSLERMTADWREEKERIRKRTIETEQAWPGGLGAVRLPPDTRQRTDQPAQNVKIKTRGLGRSIMAGGVFCILIYPLLAWRGPSPIDVRVGVILFYVGIVALTLGAILLWTGEMKGRKR